MAKKWWEVWKSDEANLENTQTAANATRPGFLSRTWGLISGTVNSVWGQMTGATTTREDPAPKTREEFLAKAEAQAQEIIETERGPFVDPPELNNSPNPAQDLGVDANSKGNEPPSQRIFEKPSASPDLGGYSEFLQNQNRPTTKPVRSFAQDITKNSLQESFSAMNSALQKIDLQDKAVQGQINELKTTLQSLNQDLSDQNFKEFKGQVQKLSEVKWQDNSPQQKKLNTFFQKVNEAVRSDAVQIQMDYIPSKGKPLDDAAKKENALRTNIIKDTAKTIKKSSEQLEGRSFSKSLTQLLGR